MGEMKPTKGPWEAVMYERGGFDIASKGADGITICSRIPFRRLAAEMTDNARLIAEAGTVFHNTGLSPVQLVEQRDELMAACKKLVEWEAREKDHAIGFMERINLCEAAFQMMYAALAKCEGVGNG